MVKLLRSPILLGALGVLLVVLALAERFVLVPTLTKLPDDIDSTVTYVGKASLLNPAALAAGDASQVLLEDVPVTLTRRARVVRSAEDVVVVEDEAVLDTGAASIPNVHTYAVDRSSFEATAPPPGATVEDAAGLVVGLPPHPRRNDSYQLYDSPTAQTVPLNYEGEAKYSGRPVAVYSSEASGPVRDPNIVRTLPPALPKSLVGALALTRLSDQLAALSPDLLALPDPVPLTFTATTKVRAWVDTATGAPLDQTIDQTIVADIKVGERTVSLLPMLAVQAEVSPDSQRELAETSTSAARLLTLVELVAPVILSLVGAFLVLIGVRTGMRRLAARGRPPGNHRQSEPDSEKRAGRGETLSCPEPDQVPAARRMSTSRGRASAGPASRGAP